MLWNRECSWMNRVIQLWNLDVWMHVRVSKESGISLVCKRDCMGYRNQLSVVKFVCTYGLGNAFQQLILLDFTFSHALVDQVVGSHQEVF